MKGKLSNPNLILEEVSEAERLQNSLNGTTSFIEEDDDREDEPEDDDIPFTKKMRIATRKVHNVSDALVNAKVGLGKSRRYHKDKLYFELIQCLIIICLNLQPCQMTGSGLRDC